METQEASKILIFGGTGYIGKYMVKASIKQGHKTYVYIRPITTQQTSLDKVELLKEFQSMGVNIVQGNLDEHDKIVELLGQVDIVISTLAYPQVLDQLKIIDAIKVAGNIKRFLPSDFGVEEDRVAPLPPFEAFLQTCLLPTLLITCSVRPYEYKEEVTIYGTGEVKAVFNSEEDIAMYTIKAAIDPRTRNRIIIYRPPENIISQLELISLWEQKTGRVFNRVHVPEEDIVRLAESLPPPENIPPAIVHSLFVKGESMSYELEEDDIEGSRLYPEYKYTAIDEFLDNFLVDPPKPAMAAFE